MSGLVEPYEPNCSPPVKGFMCLKKRKSQFANKDSQVRRYHGKEDENVGSGSPRLAQPYRDAAKVLLDATIGSHKVKVR